MGLCLCRRKQEHILVLKVNFSLHNSCQKYDIRRRRLVRTGVEMR